MRELNKGDIPVIILEILGREACHGYAIAREIERQSDQVLQLREGSLYPALRVLENNGLIEGEWEIQSSGPARKNYRLTELGRVELEKRKQDWQSYVLLMGKILGGNNAKHTA
ncbi:transcriptional regulator, PadR family [Abditibacterium utsteinense]|uniref:Transcriptional regulator, PadR family n=1 Tax=Abditibacterium utsteinense TaxID=1960156 RepID=A0A2S8SRN6_9BACT|nr:helix-turn-helix transcriptional regulator [Abditibacterium utsteinense]PQV63471.1 transcriptional regulator, PadR family [Abditibacterium utsteinense]